MPSAQGINVFISYGRKDARDLAVRLRDDLQRVGFNVWLDQREIEGGASWIPSIEAAIDDCDVLLALMSVSSYSSQWCLNEQLRANRKGKRTIPLRVMVEAEIPLHLEHLNYLDFTDHDRYDAMFRDLLSDITAGQAFRLPHAVGGGDARPSPYDSSSASGKQQRVFQSEKRSAPAFRRHLRDLRGLSWLGARFWWPYFLFSYTDIHTLAEALTIDRLLSRFGQGNHFSSRWDKYVRLYFRPRTPDLYRAEGFRPAGAAPQTGYTPIPAYLLFDMDAVLTHPDSAFSDGNPGQTGRTYKTPRYFAELPFEQIYHDSWFMPNERDEIMRCREAQVVVPDQIGLEALQVIWMRSEAEYETLHSLLAPDVWRRWRDKITARRDYHLFNNRHPYVQRAALDETQVRLHFNPCQRAADCGPFLAQVHVETPTGDAFKWQDDAYRIGRDLLLTLPDGFAGYSIQVLLDGDLAYAGQHTPATQVF